MKWGNVGVWVSRYIGKQRGRSENDVGKEGGEGKRMNSGKKQEDKDGKEKKWNSRQQVGNGIGRQAGQQAGEGRRGKGGKAGSPTGVPGRNTCPSSHRY